MSICHQTWTPVKSTWGILKIGILSAPAPHHSDLVSVVYLEPHQTRVFQIQPKMLTYSRQTHSTLQRRKSTPSMQCMQTSTVGRAAQHGHLFSCEQSRHPCCVLWVAFKPALESWQSKRHDCKNPKPYCAPTHLTYLRKSAVDSYQDWCWPKCLVEKDFNYP